ncbi:MAG TPA: NlpC/P60 family protein [Pseudolabrys sp.]|jgi:cell wall-associated NlpC family hydrolase|nr:NlpC/P60 family protein [Pseudolabrys sp.]
MVALDPRIHPFRPEIAANFLQGQVEAKRFVEGTRHQVVETSTPLRRRPSFDAGLNTEVLFGEIVTVYDIEDGWAWGQLETDGYVGWIAAAALSAPGPAATHKVSVPRTFAFPAPDVKRPPLAALPMGARLTIASQDERFAVTESGWHIPEVHLAPLKARRSDYVATAEQFLNAPYLWGGKTSLGIDCSGLVQVALHAAGLACPRDSDMQELALGKPIAASEIRRGDLLFWKGHVAIARDAETLLHANAYHMAVATEDMESALNRIKAMGSEVTSIKRV